MERLAEASPSDFSSESKKKFYLLGLNFKFSERIKLRVSWNLGKTFRRGFDAEFKNQINQINQKRNYFFLVFNTF